MNVQELDDSKDGKKRKRELTAKASKELRSVPAIVYSVEQFEIQAIELSRKGNFNFLRFIKRSTARDFRINGAVLNEMNEGNGADEGDDKSKGKGKTKKVSK
jgi:Fanconi anemia group I protein